MTRKEEIENGWFLKAVQSNHRYDERTFREAVEWADKTMYERFVKWLFDYCPSMAKDPESTIQNLKTAMEE